MGSLKPDDFVKNSHFRLSTEAIDLLLGDNSAYNGVHRAGYNGIGELYHSLQDSSTFVPFYAGFNLEHIFGGDSLEEKFEPRKHPMTLYQISKKEVWLYQSPTPSSRVESLTKFRVVTPCYIDITFICIIHSKKFFKHNYAGLFWASYIHGPMDKKIYFLGREKTSNNTHWIAAFSENHGSKSTHLWENDKNSLYFAPDFNITLANNFSDYFYQLPFYYGRFHNMVLAYFFDSSEKIRFSQSPTGGGKKNPAWDFQFILPDITVGKAYSYRSRLVYKEFIDSQDILNEYQSWKSSLN